jgi:DNA-binding response OmpR family regulator
MNLKGRKILLVDDFVSIRKTIKKELVLSGADQVDEAGNGDEALKLIADTNYDAILSDWNMPKKNGLELLKAIRADKELHNLPVMLITAETDRNMVSDAIKHKVNDFLVKPFTLQLLMERLELLLDGNFATEQEIQALLETPLDSEVLGLADEQTSFENATVMVVDDNADNLDVIVGSLKDKCQLKPSNSASVARKILEKFPVDLILLDIMMPDEDGYQFCEWIKAQDKYKNIPILFLTAKDQPNDIAKGLMLGAVDYVTKPVHPVILNARVKTHLNLKLRADRLHRQNLVLQKTVKQKEDADRMMQHDLRNPLQAILLATESSINNKEQLNDVIESVRNSTQQALNQVDQTLTIARLERGKQAIKRVDISLKDFINKFRKSMDLLAKNYGVKIRWEVDFLAGEFINIDPLFGQNLFSNLIRNAIEASEAGHIVHVEYNPADHIWRVSNPTPVPEEIIPKFFEKYSTFGKKEGNGLGTYMAKLLAHAHNGKIRLKTSRTSTNIEVLIGEPVE